MIEKGVCDKGLNWNPSYCECECDAGWWHIDYKNCKCRTRLIDKLVEECSENIDGNKMTNIALDKYKNLCRSYTIYIILFSALLTINIGKSKTKCLKYT